MSYDVISWSGVGDGEMPPTDPCPAVTVFLHVSQWDGQIVAGGRLTACAVCAGIFAVICSGGLALPVATHAPAAVYEDSATDL